MHIFTVFLLLGCLEANDHQLHRALLLRDLLRYLCSGCRQGRIQDHICRLDEREQQSQVRGAASGKEKIRLREGEEQPGIEKSSLREGEEKPQGRRRAASGKEKSSLIQEENQS